MLHAGNEGTARNLNEDIGRCHRRADEDVRVIKRRFQGRHSENAAVCTPGAEEVGVSPKEEV